jgi:hypothetical protein
MALTCLAFDQMMAVPALLLTEMQSKFLPESVYRLLHFGYIILTKETSVFVCS